MSQRHGWDIRTRMLAISLGPALLLTLLLTAYFTYSRLQDLRQELTHTGQLIADQLAPAAEYGVIAGNTPVLQKLLQATLDTRMCASSRYATATTISWCTSNSCPARCRTPRRSTSSTPPSSASVSPWPATRCWMAPAKATASPARTTSAGWWSACPTTPSASGNRKSS